MLNHGRALAAFAFAAVLLTQGQPPRAQSLPPVNPDDILYILPVTTANTAQEIGQLRSRIGEGRYVKVGFSRYVFMEMENWNVDITNQAAVRAALSSTVAIIDVWIKDALEGGFPLGLNFALASRSAYDPVQQASEDEDRRNMMWYSDNLLAAGWWNYSRYSRKQLRIQEAYWRELGRIVADRMARYPETLVAAAGDGEVELSLDRANGGDPQLTVYADYSPFTVAEFRDWARAGGLYGTGQIYAGQAYEKSGRYAGDASPAADTNGDGHTFNGDFATSFDTWDLKFFDWKLTDTETQGAIPKGAAFNPSAVSNPNGFDAPRVRGAKPSNYFAQTTVDAWKLWLMFRSAMLQRHNTDVAKWMTTSASTDAGTVGATVPRSKWSSYQIPADYLFNGSPSNPNSRYESSGSSWTTADISPYGQAGFTAFNVNFLCDPAHPLDGCGGEFPYFLTLNGLAPAIASRNLRFSLLEWHPSVLPGSGATPPENPFLYSNELALIKKYRPTIVVPFLWGSDPLSQVNGTGFETMLNQLATDLKDGLPSDPRLSLDGAPTGRRLAQPFTLTGAAFDRGKVRGSGRDTGIDAISVRAVPVGGGAAVVLAGATYGEPRSDVASVHGTQFGPSGLRVTVNNLTAGDYDFIVSGHSTVTGLNADSSPVRITVLGSFSVDHSSLRFAAVRGATTFTSLTAPQELLLTQTGTASPWTATSSDSWLQVSPSTGSGTKTLTVSINTATAPIAGAPTATVTFAATNGLAEPKTVGVTLTIAAAGSTTPPGGSFDTPADGSTVSGSIAVTGWAVDDVEVTGIQIWRDKHSSEAGSTAVGPTDPRAGKIFIGNATFVEGARPDVEAFSPNTPRNYRAGWGYIMLTRGLIWDGKGAFKLYAYTFDVEGNLTTLGNKTITINNAASTKPFGAIDTPGQGETVSGIVNSFGWVLAAPGRTISQQNVGVYIDGVLVGSPGGLSRRPDLDAAFEPLGINTSQANRVIAIDTTKLTNGVHTIGWFVTDNMGEADGVGSRFFRVQNTNLTTDAPPASSAARNSRKPGGR